MRQELWSDGELIAVDEVPDIAETPPTPEERIAALEDAVDTLILTTLEGS